MGQVVTTDKSDVPRGDAVMGARLAAERRRLRKTAEEFATVGGVKRNAQSEYENGKRFFQVDYLRRVAAIGVDPTYVMTGERSPSADDLPPTLVTLQVVLPPRLALARMFEGVLQVYPDLRGAELAQALARHLPSGLAQLTDLLPQEDEASAIAPTPDRDRLEGHPGPRRARHR